MGQLFCYARLMMESAMHQPLTAIEYLYTKMDYFIFEDNLTVNSQNSQFSYSLVATKVQLQWHADIWSEYL